MQNVQSLRAFSHAKSLTFTAVFAALCCVGTLVVRIPLPNGYLNTGDVFVLLAAWCLGPLYGGVAAGMGSALADIISGYAIYCPATFLIKGGDALLAFTVCLLLKKLIKKESLDFIPRFLSACVGELFMVLGYFLYECILYGYGGAISTVSGNLLQGALCLCLATMIFSLLYPVRAIRNFFPALGN